MRLPIGPPIASMIILGAALWLCPQVSAQLSVSSNLVQVGVVVTNDKGPVLGLKPEDFVVLDEGKPRKIGVFLEESQRAAPQTAVMQPATLQPAVLAKNTFSNAAPVEHGATMTAIQASGTPTIILLDSLNTLYGSAPAALEQTPTWMEDSSLASAKKRLIAVLKEMDAHSPIAVYGLGTQLKMLCDFTCSHEELLAAVKRYDPTAKTSREAVEPAGFRMPGDPAAETAPSPDRLALAGQMNGVRAQDTMVALQTIVARVSAIPGRKNLLWLTGNLPFSGEAIARAVTPAKIAIYPVDTRGLETWAFDSVASGATFMATPGFTARDMQGVSKSPGTSRQPIGIDTMLEMAADTGGVAYVNTNDIAGAVHAVVDGPSVTYTIGFYINAQSVDSKFHELKIQVKGENVQLRYPRGYFAMPNQPAQQAESAGQQRLLTAAIRGPFQASAVPLHVKLEREGQPEENSLRVEGTVGVQGLSLPQDGATRHGTLDVYTIEQDATGNVLKHTTNQMQLSLTSQQFDDYVKSGVQFSEVIQPQPETATVRVIVRDAATSRMGSVIIPLAKVQ